MTHHETRARRGLMVRLVRPGCVCSSGGGGSATSGRAGAAGHRGQPESGRHVARWDEPAGELDGITARPDRGWSASSATCAPGACSAPRCTSTRAAAGSAALAWMARRRTTLPSAGTATAALAMPACSVPCPRMSCAVVPRPAWCRETRRGCSNSGGQSTPAWDDSRWRQAPRARLPVHAHSRRRASCETRRSVER